MLNRKGQSILEYALIIAIVIAGLLLMMHYVRRGYAGRLKSASDDMGEQYDPSAYTGNYQVTQYSNTVQSVQSKETSTEHAMDQQNIRNGTENIAAWTENQELYTK